MAKAPKKPASTAKKAPAKAAPKATAKPAVKAVAKPAPKAAAAKPVATASVTPLKPVAQVKTTQPGSKAPSWVNDALAYAQQNPAVTLVGVLAAALGLVLLFS